MAVSLGKITDRVGAAAVLADKEIELHNYMNQRATERSRRVFEFQFQQQHLEDEYRDMEVESKGKVLEAASVRDTKIANVSLERGKVLKHLHETHPYWMARIDTIVQETVGAGYSAALPWKILLRDSLQELADIFVDDGKESLIPELQELALNINAWSGGKLAEKLKSIKAKGQELEVGTNPAFAWCKSRLEALGKEEKEAHDYAASVIREVRLVHPLPYCCHDNLYVPQEAKGLEDARLQKTALKEEAERALRSFDEETDYHAMKLKAEIALLRSGVKPDDLPYELEHMSLEPAESNPASSWEEEKEGTQPSEGQQTKRQQRTSKRSSALARTGTNVLGGVSRAGEAANPIEEMTAKIQMKLGLKKFVPTRKRPKWILPCNAFYDLNSEINARLKSKRLELQALAKRWKVEAKPLIVDEGKQLLRDAAHSGMHLRCVVHFIAY